MNMNDYCAAGMEDKKTGNARVNVTLRLSGVTIVALENHFKKCNVYHCTGTEALYRPYGPKGE